MSDAAVKGFLVVRLAREAVSGYHDMHEGPGCVACAIQERVVVKIRAALDEAVAIVRRAPARDDEDAARFKRLGAEIEALKSTPH